MSIHRVKQKAQEADEMIRQMAAAAKGQVEATDAEADGTDDESSTPTAEIVDLNPEDQAPTVESDEVVEMVQAPDPAQEEIAKLRADLEALQHWRSTTEGIVRSKDERISELRDIIANMQAAPAPAPAEPPPASGYSAEDVSQFGDDMIDLVQRVSRQVAQDMMAELKTTIQGMEGNLQNVQKQAAVSAEQAFQNRLNALSPGWEKIDGDAKFVEWLRESPTRNNLFAEAVKSLDAVAVADVMNLYGQLNGTKDAAVQQQSASKQAELEKQVAPGKSRKSAPPSKSRPEDKIWTRSEIQSTYLRKKEFGKDEFAALEREIAKAQREQRVDYSR